MKSIRDHVYVDEGNVNEAQENGGEDPTARVGFASRF